MKGFLDFIREQGVVGLAIGFILGGAVSKLVAALVEDIISPILAIGLNNLENLSDAYLQVGSARIMWGDFLNVTVDFIVIALVVYFGVKALKLDKADKKKK